jgi:MscS family membrane protein
MRFRLGIAALALFSALGAARAAPQIPGLSPTPTPTPETPGDPYKRETPYGSFFGFMRAAARENWDTAGAYLQWPKNARTPAGDMAKQLKAVLDERFTGDLEKLSRSTLGDLNDGLGPDLERAGTVERGDESFDVLLVRTQPEEGPAVWLVSSQTLREVPAAFRGLRAPELDRAMPEALRSRVGGALHLWQVLAFLLLIPIAFLVARLLLFGGLKLVRRDPVKHPGLEAFRSRLNPFRAPAALLLAVFLHAAVITQIGLPLLSRYGYGRLVRVLAIFAIGWFFVRLVGFFSSRATMRLIAAGGTATSSLTIGRRVLQGLVALGTALVILGLLGVNLTATLAGLGIGGIAVAFAAQKSLENLFAGFVILSEKTLRVGDTVRVGPVMGDVEDVTLYATRLRTLDRSVVSIPNGSMMTSQIENLSRRDKFLFRHMLGLRFETTGAQIQAVLEGCRTRLAADKRVEAATLRVRFVKVNAYTLDLDVLAYLLVPDWLAFLEAQEELLLALIRVVEEAGSGFAFPTSTTYLASEARTLEPGAGKPAPPG